MANQQILEGPQIHGREKEILMDICKKVGCVFAQTSLGICKVKYEGDIYNDFDVTHEGNCETACIPDEKSKNRVRPVRVWANGKVEFLAGQVTNPIIVNPDTGKKHVFVDRRVKF